MSWPSSFCDLLIPHFFPAYCGPGDILVAEKENIKSASLAEAPPHPHPLLTFVKSGILVTLLILVTKLLKNKPQEGRFILAHSLGVYVAKVGNAWPQ